ncbi:MAG: M1 family metallopeptidase [bacterium]|nr:M1 family metallopeptidase [bacterium]
MRQSLSCVAAVVVAASAFAQDPRADYDVLRYDLALEVFPERKELEGAVTVEARVLAEELTRLRLDLKQALEVRRVVAGDVELTFEHEGDRLDIALPAAREAGDEVSVTVHYGGSPRARGGFSGFHWAETADGRPWINTSCQGPGAHSWWPCKASFFHPEDKPEGIAMHLTVPADLYGVSNGRLAGVREHEDGRKTFDWVHDYPLETYTVTLNVAPYVVVESELELPGHDAPLPFVYYVLPENAEKAALQFQDVPRLLEIYSEAFGPFPFPRSKFGLVETNFWGMEHSTAVAYGSSYPAWCKANGETDPYASRNRYFDYILVHEVAHEWWGNAVSANDWGHFWVHEGFGTYAEGVYVEKTRGREVADEYFASQAKTVGERSRLFRGAGTDSSQAYSGTIYFKGACVLNTLRHYVANDEAWWAALREFNMRHRYGNADTEDFRAVLEEKTERSWKPFFDQWFYGEGYPKLSGTVRVDGVELVLEIENGASGETGFRVPLDLAWTVDSRPQEHRVWIEPGRFEARVPCGGEPSDLEVRNLGRVLGRHDVRVAR